MGSYHLGHQILAAISNILHFHPWGKVYWAVLSGTGFHSSCCTREVPHFPDTISGQPLTQHPHSYHLFLADHSSPSQLWNWPTFPVLPWRAWCQTTAWDLLSPLPFLLAARPALDSLHLVTLVLIPLTSISSHKALSSFPEGPCSALNSIFLVM